MGRYGQGDTGAAKVDIKKLMKEFYKAKKTKTKYLKILKALEVIVENDHVDRGCFVLNQVSRVIEELENEMEYDISEGNKQDFNKDIENIIYQVAQGYEELKDIEQESIESFYYYFTEGLTSEEQEEYDSIEDEEAKDEGRDKKIQENIDYTQEHTEVVENLLCMRLLHDLLQEHSKAMLLDSVADKQQ